MSIIEKLTEGIISRNVQKEGQAVLNKWEKTGLLEGIKTDNGRNNMAALLENQAKELLREASSMAGGDVEGFAAVAFPIVRRVFGGLIANELVSVQPMSLPSGLIFFLDFTYGNSKLGKNAGSSIYGGNRVGAEITGGVNVDPVPGNAALGSNKDQQGFYNLHNGYASPTGSIDRITFAIVASGTFGASYSKKDAVASSAGFQYAPGGVMTAAQFDSLCRYDPDFVSGTTKVLIAKIVTASTSLHDTTNGVQMNFQNLVALSASTFGVSTSRNVGLTGTLAQQVRRLTQWSGSLGGRYDASSDSKADLLVFFATNKANGSAGLNGSVTRNMQKEITQGVAHGGTNAALAGIHMPIKDQFVDGDNGSGDSLGAIVGASTWGLEKNTAIPEIDIKVDSVAITALTKKLKAKWTPELQQDINAYHNLDAEVELTGILSETIALEIDQEILEELIKGATGATLYWSRKPGKFVDRERGGSVNESLFPDFTGTVSEWYETLLETVNDVSAAIHRKTLRGGANFLVTSPEVANLLEFTSGFRADTTGDEARGTAGAVKVGSISKKWDVYVDPYFPRNVVLVGRKGSSFLESGFVYAPYVPLQVTPTIFGPEDFVPRKGVMTRYGKKMVRPDMYGLVIVEDLV